MYLVALNSFRYPLISGSWTTNSLICSSFFFYWLNISSSSDTNIIYIDSLFWAMTVFSILTSPNFKKSLVRFFIPLWAIALLAYVGKQYFCNQERVNGVFLFLEYFWLFMDHWFEPRNNFFCNGSTIFTFISLKISKTKSRWLWNFYWKPWINFTKFGGKEPVLSCGNWSLEF